MEKFNIHKMGFLVFVQNVLTPLTGCILAFMLRGYSARCLYAKKAPTQTKVPEILVSS